MTSPEIRREALIRMRQAAPAEPEERITPLRLLGWVAFCLVFWIVLAYALPVVLIGLFGGAA